MFDRVEYKRIAKKQLKGRWRTPILATLIVLAITLIICAPEAIKTIKEQQGIDTGVPSYVGLIPELIMIGIMGILELAYTKLFLDLWKTRDPLPFSSFLSAFSLWLKGVLGMLWMYLWVFLWACLFIIPGIVKAYAYSQMFFILAENPKIGVRKAMRLSKEITRGYKGDLFVMDLSFLGWLLLSPFTLYILFLYVVPYMQMSKTNAYKMLKAMAIKAGRISADDFGETAEPEKTDEGAPAAEQEAAAQASGWDTAGAEDVEAHEAPAEPAAPAPAGAQESAGSPDAIITPPPAPEDGSSGL